jgi:hypothetical protein
MLELPIFKYHPEPLKTGSVVPSDKACEVCRLRRGFAYSGSPYTVDSVETICPWCIADGSAHDKFGAEFVDREFVGGGGWDSVAPGIADEVAFRTPGFSGWQQERWFAHCRDAGEFLGPMGKHELESLGHDAIHAIRSGSDYSDNEWKEFFESLDAKHGPATAYLFRCRHCGKLGGYSDCR